MMFDLQSLFSDKQAITASAPSENVINFGVPGTPQHAAGPVTQDVGRGHPTPIRIQATEDFNNLTSLTVEVQIDSDEAFGSAETVSSSTATLAQLKAGFVFAPQYLPLGMDKQYTRLNYVVAGTAPTSGTIVAGLVSGNEAWSA